MHFSSFLDFIEAIFFPASRQKVEGVGGRKLFACEPSEAAPPAERSRQRPAEKCSHPFRRKNRARAKSEKRRIFFCGARERSERRRGGSFLVRMFVKVGSDFNQKVPFCS